LEEKEMPGRFVPPKDWEAEFLIVSLSIRFRLMEPVPVIPKIVTV
jgi:hypothetical protein